MALPVLALAVGIGGLLLAAGRKVTAALRQQLGPDDFPESVPDRDAYILAQVQAGNYTAVSAPITSEIPGHTASFNVMADALKVNGVRVNLSAAGQQRVADALNCLLLTPKLADLIWYQRVVTLPPFPRSATQHDLQVMGTVERMIWHSQKIDSALAALGGAGAGGLICTVGKHWVIDDALLAHPNKAENYGWHNTQTGPGCVTRESTTCRVIQDPGWAHNALHADYSQTCVLVSRQCTVDGQPMDLETLLQDPTLAPLASSTGAMKVLRQPGVPPSPPPNVAGTRKP